MVWWFCGGVCVPIHDKKLIMQTHSLQLIKYLSMGCNFIPVLIFFTDLKMVNVYISLYYHISNFKIFP